MSPTSRLSPSSFSSSSCNSSSSIRVSNPLTLTTHHHQQQLSPQHSQTYSPPNTNFVYTSPLLRKLHNSTTSPIKITSSFASHSTTNITSIDTLPPSPPISPYVRNRTTPMNHPPILTPVPPTNSSPPSVVSQFNPSLFNSSSMQPNDPFINTGSTNSVDSILTLSPSKSFYSSGISSHSIHSNDITRSCNFHTGNTHGDPTSSPQNPSTKQSTSPPPSTTTTATTVNTTLSEIPPATPDPVFASESSHPCDFPKYDPNSQDNAKILAENALPVSTRPTTVSIRNKKSFTTTTSHSKSSESHDPNFQPLNNPECYRVLKAHSVVVKCFKQDPCGYYRREMDRAKRYSSFHRRAKLLSLFPETNAPPPVPSKRQRYASSPVVSRPSRSSKVTKPSTVSRSISSTHRGMVNGNSATSAHNQNLAALPSSSVLTSSASPASRLPRMPTTRDDSDYNSIPDLSPPLETLMHQPKLLKADWKGQALDLSQDPDRHLLHEAEIGVAATLRLSCAIYLTSKRRIFQARVEALRIGKEFRKTDAQQACKIDVNKASKLWTAFDRVGWFERHYFEKYL